MQLAAPLFVLLLCVFPVLILALTLRRAQDMEAVIMRERLTGRITKLWIGPCWFIFVPGIDRIETIDLHFHRNTLDGLYIHTHDGQAASVTVTVGWELDIDLLRKAELRKVRRFLPGVEEIMVYWLQLTVRAAISRYNLDSLLHIMRRPRGLQTLLKAELQERVEIVGVRVLSLDLICLPAPSVVAARVTAEARAQELQTVAAARAREIELLSQALSTCSAGDQLVRLLSIDALRSGNNHIIASMGWGGPQNDNDAMPIQFVVGRDD